LTLTAVPGPQALMFSGVSAGVSTSFYLDALSLTCALPAGCASCPAGSYSTLPAAPCTACPEGTFSGAGAPACTACSCAPGYAALGNGSTTCTGTAPACSPVACAGATCTPGCFLAAGSLCAGGVCAGGSLAAIPAGATYYTEAGTGCASTAGINGVVLASWNFDACGLVSQTCASTGVSSRG
jgi:hypothetical protein